MMVLFVCTEKYYPDHKRDEGPSITRLVKQHVDNMSNIMTESVTTNTVLDVESKVRGLLWDRFREGWKD